MALVKRHNLVKSKSFGVVSEKGLGLGLGLGLVRNTGTFGRKRIVISSITEGLNIDLGFETPVKKRCGERVIRRSEKSCLEALPQDILIKVLCGVEHDDLKQLFLVSKAIRDAALIAKQWHFAYSTPSKTRAFRSAIDLDDSGDFDEIETPNAPKRLKKSYRSRIGGKNLANISVALFT